jgi:hypothetical protein
MSEFQQNMEFQGVSDIFLLTHYLNTLYNNPQSAQDSHTQEVRLQNAKTLNLEVFDFISQNSWKTVIPALKTCFFWRQWRYQEQIQTTSFSYHKNQILESKWGWQPSLPHSCPPENCHLCTKKEILCTSLQTTFLHFKLSWARTEIKWSWLKSSIGSKHHKCQNFSPYRT